MIDITTLEQVKARRVRRTSTITDVDWLLDQVNCLLDQVARLQRAGKGRQRTTDQAHARTDDPETSHQAAASVRDLRASQRTVLRIIERLATTDEGLIYSHNHGATAGYWPRQSDSGLRTRRRELVDLGLVSNSGSRARTRGGRKAIIWAITEKGRDQAWPTT